jgi:hypothetical protein
MMLMRWAYIRSNAIGRILHVSCSVRILEFFISNGYVDGYVILLNGIPLFPSSLTCIFHNHSISYQITYDILLS